MTDKPCTDNINILYNNQFKLVIGRGTKQMELMCQRASLPGIKINSQTQPTTLGTTIPVPSLSVAHEPLNIEFIVDSNLQNWNSLYSWIRNISNISDDKSYNTDYQNWHHGAVLYVYNPHFKFQTSVGQPSCNNVLFTVNFNHMIPVSLSGLNFQSDSSDIIPQRATCSFTYSYYNIIPDPPNLLN
jgi:hypothetical protein